jgi:hypothetical protein
LAKFLDTTYFGDVEPVPFGSHNGVAYFLDTAQDDIPGRGLISLTHLDRMRGTSDYVKSYEFEILPNSRGLRPNLRYGFGLGPLMHRPVEVEGARKDEGGDGGRGGGEGEPDLESTGFFVIYNAVDRSIWVTVDFKPFVNAATEFRTDPLPSTWGLIPEDEKLQIGTTRISQANWWKSDPLVATGGDPFAVFPPCGWQMISKPAVLSEYLEWLPKA